MIIDPRITEPGRIWYIEPNYDPGRMIEIYEAIKDLPVNSVLDVGCGNGLIAEGLSWVIDGVIEQFDIVSYPEWEHLSVKPFIEDIRDFVKKDRKYDLVLFLNSYRNWDDEPRKEFNEWLKRNAKYFITSCNDQDAPVSSYKKIGRDSKGHTLKLYTL